MPTGYPVERKDPLQMRNFYIKIKWIDVLRPGLARRVLYSLRAYQSQLENLLIKGASRTMTTIKIDNLNDSQELDRDAVAELQGGFMMPYFAQNLLYSVTENINIREISAAPINYNNVADNGSVANSTGNTFTSVIGSMSVVTL
jgi:hypothetical protein